MASQEEVKLCQQILALAIKVNAQGKYSVWVDFSGHVHQLEVRVTTHWDLGNADIEGWRSGDRGVYLSTDQKPGWLESMQDVIDDKVEQLRALNADLSKFLSKRKRLSPTPL